MLTIAIGGKRVELNLVVFIKQNRINIEGMACARLITFYIFEVIKHRDSCQVRGGSDWPIGL